MLRAKKINNTVLVLNNKEELLHAESFKTPEAAQQATDAFNAEEKENRGSVTAKVV